MRGEKLSISQIIIWIKNYNKRFGKFPTSRSGKIENTNEDWCNINHALNEGHRGLPFGLSLSKLIEKHFTDYINHKKLSDLTEDKIVNWIKEYKNKYDKYPTYNSGQIDGTNETWAGVDISLKKSLRKLPKSSLSQLKEKIDISYRNKKKLPKLTEDQIVNWIKEYKDKNGKYPTIASGQIEGTQETWDKIGHAIYKELRGLKGKSSLVKLMKKYFPDYKRKQIF